MLKKPILVIIYILYVVQAKSQDSLRTSLLWEISGNGLTSSSYLFGTIHTRCGEDYKMPKVAIEKLKLCNSLFEEVDINDPLYYNKYIENMHWDKKLDSLLGDSVFKAASKIFLEITKQPLSKFNQIHPFLTNQFYNQKSLICNKKTKNLEQELIQIANKNRIDIDGLESAEKHLKVVQQMPDMQQLYYLLQNIFQKDSMNFYYKKVVDEFKKNDFVKTVFEKNIQYTKEDSVLIINRNLSWLSTICWRIKLESTFFAVGASHLGFENGLIALLRKKGYTLKPIRL